jgi:hypothetical protein
MTSPYPTADPRNRESPQRLRTTQRIVPPQDLYGALVKAGHDAPS